MFCSGETVKVLYSAFVVISLNLLHHQHFHRSVEVREALRALYLKSDSSRFQYLLGFGNVAAGIVIEDEIRPDVAEVLPDIEVHEQKRPFDTKGDLLDKIWNNDNIDKTKVTNSEEPIDFDEDKNYIKKETSPDTAPQLKGNGSIQDPLQCVKCGKKFRQYGAAFRRHKIMKHKEKEEEIEKEWETLQHNFQCPCEICGKKFFNRHSMQDHRRREHPMKRNIDEQERKRIKQESGTKEGWFVNAVARVCQ